MKKILMFVCFFCLAGIIMTSCKKVGIVPDQPEIQVSGLKVVLINDTVNVQIKTAVTFKAVGLTNCTWAIHDGTNTITLSGEQVTLGAGFQFLGVDLVQVTGTNSGNQTTLTKYVKVVLDLVTTEPIIYLSSHPTSSPDTVENWFALSKERMKFTGYYFHIGNYIPSIWVYPIAVPTADTACYLSGTTPTPAPSGDPGQWIVVKIKNAKGKHYEMGVGKINASNTQIWGNFEGSQWVSATNGYLIVWNTDANGIPVIPSQNNDWPLETGDVGNSPVVRLDQQDTKVILGFNNGVEFSNNQPWVRFRGSDYSWGTPIAQSALAGWPNWGQYELPYSQIPANNLIRFQIGTNINMPSYLNVNMDQSSMYDSFYNELRLSLIKTTVMRSDGRIEKIALVVQE